MNHPVYVYKHYKQQQFFTYLHIYYIQWISIVFFFFLPPSCIRTYIHRNVLPWLPITGSHINYSRLQFTKLPFDNNWCQGGRAIIYSERTWGRNRRQAKGLARWRKFRKTQNLKDKRCHYWPIGINHRV